MAVLGEEDRELPRAQRIEGLRLIVEETDILPGIEFAQRLAQVGTLAPPEGLLLTADQIGRASCRERV